MIRSLTMCPAGKKLLLCLLLLVMVHSNVGFSCRRTPKMNALKAVDFSSSVGAVRNRRETLRSTLVAALSFVTAGIRPAGAAYLDPNTDMPRITKRVYLDVQIERDTDPTRLVIGLFGEAMPRTTENFEILCKGSSSSSSGGKSYAGTTFYRILSDMTVQGGAIGDESGKTGMSSLEGGVSFEPDNYNIKHTKAGLVSMVRGLDGGVDSRFFINTSDDGGWADDRYAVFGIVEGDDGMDFVHKMEKVPVKRPQNSPKEPVKIVASGILSD